jgi:hypothetical protein
LQVLARLFDLLADFSGCTLDRIASLTKRITGFFSSAFGGCSNFCCSRFDIGSGGARGRLGILLGALAAASHSK